MSTFTFHFPLLCTLQFTFHFMASYKVDWRALATAWAAPTSLPLHLSEEWCNFAEDPTTPFLVVHNGIACLKNEGS